MRVRWPPWNSFRWARGRSRKLEKQLEVVRLDYDGVEVEKIIKWYDRIKAPFAEGGRRKEFPDAFAVDMLDIYATPTSVVGRCGQGAGTDLFVQQEAA